MSIIFGIDESTKLYLCGDRRTTKVDGTIISDDMNKLTVVNHHLAFASAGNAAIERAIQIDSEKTERNILTVDSMIRIIEDFYDRVRSINAKDILALPFYCLIAGVGNDSKYKLINLGFVRGNLSYKQAHAALYPPNGLNLDACNQIFVNNYREHHDSFCENTVRDISKISKFVSRTGDKWVFDKLTGIGNLYTF